MTETQWAELEGLARRHGLSDAEIFGLAVGCPRHGNGNMDFDDDGIFCHSCEVSA